MNITYILLCSILSYTCCLTRGLECEIGEFKCSNEECIQSYSACDGTKDCQDGSDETLEVCSKLKIPCPPYAFRCAYGGCIDKINVCDGKPDCADNSDELSPPCEKTVPPINENKQCRSEEFECSSGQCVSLYSVCDGLSDCDDHSDETELVCLKINCPAVSFQCSYGACIEKVKKCNGKKDCFDNSDENNENCSTENIKTTEAPPPPPTNGCLLPAATLGLSYIVNGCLNSDTSPKCRRVPGTVVEAFTVLTFNCSSGYTVSGDSLSISYSYCIDKTWQPPAPVCAPFKQCKPLLSSSVDIECWYKGEMRPCNKPLPPGTKAKVSCKQSYLIADPSASFIQTACLPSGKWESPLFRCRPACGRVASKEKDVVGASRTGVGKFPWMAVVYQRIDNSFERHCSGTILTPHIILTAAHCVYDINLFKPYDISLMKVAIGKFRPSWYLHDPYQQQHDVRSIQIEPRYIGYTRDYDMDIALIDLVNTIVLNEYVLPVCLNLVYPFQYPVGTSGTMVGWSLSSRNGQEELKSVSLPYLDYVGCVNKASKDFKKYITHDKFCTSKVEGIEVQTGDAGAGLTIKAASSGRHYIYGVLSVKAGNTLFAAFTNLSIHANWLQTTMNQLKRLHPL